MHELLHQTITSEGKVSKKFYQAQRRCLPKLFPNVSPSVRRHIIIYPLEFQIGATIFGKEYVQKVIQTFRKKPDQLKYWEVIDQISQNILEDDIFEKISKLSARASKQE